MRHQNNFLGIPTLGLNFLSFACGVFIVCTGIRIARGADLAVETANAKLTATGSASRLAELANQLKEQSELIKQKDKAYQDLQQVYDRSLKDKDEYQRLQTKIEKVDKIPTPENIESIIDEIQSTEQLLIDTVSE